MTSWLLFLSINYSSLIANAGSLWLLRQPFHLKDFAVRAVYMNIVRKSFLLTGKS